MYVRRVSELSAQGAKVVLRGAIDRATAMGVPQCVAVVDTGGNLLVFERMDGAKLHSQFSAIQKAFTAISAKAPTGQLPTELAFGIALATNNRFATIAGGLPIELEGEIVGAIGVGSGNDEEDIEVAQAGIEALQNAIAHHA
ncbi:heme-binding protein [Phormidium sp. FACHB-592]|uniref:Heme-binding protein n=1 Tax=Stenomitos frigidus AS-A4 TaxID=2933935 RepID=A0ABV0KCV3_9CYAN|nr:MULTISPECIES: heme-binding protein [Cyanophyceae]MBD2038393.1 heme-binding protein [Leptolyngbya sp. FACHB-321]MBD2077490.1 heme-binding protein [Phormidium sp. FACHB-592]